MSEFSPDSPEPHPTDAEPPEPVRSKHLMGFRTWLKRQIRELKDAWDEGWEEGKAERKQEVENKKKVEEAGRSSQEFLNAELMRKAVRNPGGFPLPEGDVLTTSIEQTLSSTQSKNTQFVSNRVETFDPSTLSCEQHEVSVGCHSPH